MDFLTNSNKNVLLHEINALFTRYRTQFLSVSFSLLRSWHEEAIKTKKNSNLTNSSFYIKIRINS